MPPKKQFKISSWFTSVQQNSDDNEMNSVDNEMSSADNEINSADNEKNSADNQINSDVTTSKNNSTTTSTASTTSSTTSTTTSTTRSFQTKWLTTYSWLEFVDEKKHMICKLCKETGQRNVYTSGAKNFRTSSLEEHQRSNDHQASLRAPVLQQAFTQAQKNAQSEEEKATIVSLKTAFWLCAEGLPLVKFRSLLGLHQTLNVPHLLQSYDSSYAATEFVTALSDVIEDRLKEKLRASPFITVLADESTDITVSKRLVIYAHLINKDSMKMETEFITNLKITDASGAGLSSTIYTEMRKRGVEPDKILGLGSDGASVMTGKIKGTTGMMMRQNPHLLNVHCVAHRLALCTSQAADKVPAIKDYQETITSLYYYFKHSPSRQDRLKDIEVILEAPLLKYKEVHSVRWLSFYNALEAIYRTIDALLTYLAENATQKDPKAVGLKKKIANLKFIGLTHVMMDIIPIVTKLSLFFQKEDVDVALVGVNVKACIQALTQLQTQKGSHESLLYENREKNLYLGHMIADVPIVQLNSAKEKFIAELISNIQARFPDTDLLTAFGVLSMRPLSFLSAEERREWGNEEINTLARHYGEDKTFKWKEEREEHSKTSEAIISSEDTLAEWQDVKEKVLALHFPRDNTNTLWHLINKFCHDDFPNLIKLACLALTCPVHTAGCERGFSVQNQILTNLRNRLTPELQDMLLRIKTCGLSLAEFPFSDALKSWREAKRRHLFSRKRANSD